MESGKKLDFIVTVPVALTPLFSGSGRLPCGLGGIFSLEKEL